MAVASQPKRKPSTSTRKRTPPAKFPPKPKRKATKTTFQPGNQAAKKRPKPAHSSDQGGKSQVGGEGWSKLPDGSSAADITRAAFESALDGMSAAEREQLTKTGLVRNPDQRPAHVLGTKFSPGNPYRWQKGVSGNPGGRPKGMSAAYRDWLALVNPASGMTNAQLAATSLGERMVDEGDGTIAREFRQATEGETVNFNTFSDAELLAKLQESQAKVNALLAQQQGSANMPEPAPDADEAEGDDSDKEPPEELST